VPRLFSEDILQGIQKLEADSAFVPRPADRPVQNATPTPSVAPTDTIAPSLPDDPDSQAELEKMFAETTGVRSVELSAEMIDRVATYFKTWSNIPLSQARKMAVDMFFEMKPTNIKEAMLCDLTIGIYRAAAFHLEKATFGGEQADSHLKKSARLAGVFRELTTDLTRLQGRVVQQNVKVTHVHIQGGQNNIGAINEPCMNQTDNGNQDSNQTESGSQDKKR
jgi:hypothetical protein